MLDALINPPASTGFQSVKLPSSLVSAAKESAQIFRRSTAGQIEYWAALGKSMESQGLTAEQAKMAVQKNDMDAHDQAVFARWMQSETSGKMAQSIQEVLAEDLAKMTANTAA
jgi:ParD-like antitoxin of type II bacterial toxin-antitoxin system